MLKKPLVLTNGEIEQLQPSDLLSPVPNSLSLTNGDVVDLIICTPVYVSTVNTIKYATASTNPNVIGLLAQPIVIGDTGRVQTDGKLTALTTDWDAHTGGSGGLTPGATYYLNTLGNLTTTPPTTGYLVRIGIAVNQTDLEIKISRPIKL